MAAEALITRRAECIDDSLIAAEGDYRQDILLAEQLTVVEIYDVRETEYTAANADIRKDLWRVVAENGYDFYAPAVEKAFIATDEQLHPRDLNTFLRLANDPLEQEVMGKLRGNELLLRKADTNLSIYLNAQAKSDDPQPLKWEAWIEDKIRTAAVAIGNIPNTIKNRLKPPDDSDLAGQVASVDINRNKPDVAAVAAHIEELFEPRDPNTEPARVTVQQEEGEDEVTGHEQRGVVTQMTEADMIASDRRNGPHSRLDEIILALAHMPARLLHRMEGPVPYDRRAQRIVIRTGSVLTGLTIAGLWATVGILEARGYSVLGHISQHGASLESAPNGRAALQSGASTNMIPPNLINRHPHNATKRPRLNLQDINPGETIYNVLQHAGMRAQNIMTNLKGAIVKSGLHYQEHGAGANEWFSVDGDSTTKGILGKVGKFLSWKKR